MYGRGAGPIAGSAGIAMLPNTGGNELLLVVSVLSIVVGSVILLTTIARSVAKKALSA